jgi:hypothetical protein
MYIDSSLCCTRTLLLFNLLCAQFDQLSYLAVTYPDRTALEVSFVGSMQSGLINILGLILPVIIQKIGYRGCMHIGTVSESTIYM